MSNLSQIESLQECFQSEFVDIKLDYQPITMTTGLVHAFFVKIDSEEVLKKVWRKISNFIALYFQNNLENEFERWNLYLFFLINQKISDDLKYQIVNDTFSSRKMIIDQKIDQNSIINEYILNNNLNIDKENAKATEDDFQSDILIWDLLKDKIFRNVRITTDIEKSFSQLVKTIKEKDHEI